MQTIQAALEPELARMLALRDIASASRHILAMEPGADSVTYTVRCDRDGVAVDVHYFSGSFPLCGWGQ